ncbi:MAG: hypothetical protein LBP53_00650 [Candidatus Peribacteria bacterium]|nr:hypothetical protein [Candidatus Peribacteria bacterium]
MLVQPLATTQSFTFTIRQPFDDDFIVPTNGQTTFSGKIPYSWEIFLDGVSQGIFTGVSKNVNASTV